MDRRGDENTVKPDGAVVRVGDALWLDQVMTWSSSSPAHAGYS